MTLVQLHGAALHTLLAFASIAMIAGCTRGSPEEEKALRTELHQAFAQREFDRAVDLARRLTEASPRDESLWEQLVNAHLYLENVGGAKQALTEWRRRVRKPNAAYHELFGDVAVREQKTSTALASWNTALTADPANRHVLGKLAQLHRGQRDWQQEDAALSKMIALQEDAAKLGQRAVCRRRLHRWSEAQEDLRRARTLAPDDADVRRAAEFFDRLTPFLSAIRALDARLAVTPGDDQLLADRALLFLRGEDAELALYDSEAAAKTAPWAMRPRLFQAIALRALGRKADAEKLGAESGLRLNVLSPEFLETIGRLDSEISVERQNAELYVARAWQLNEINQPTLALEDAEMAQRLDEKSASGFVEASYALAKLGRADDAIAQIRRATELDANHATAWHYRGELEMSVGDHSAAVESLTRALAINQTPAALQKREECYVKLGLLAKAEEDHRAREALTGTAVTP